LIAFGVEGAAGAGGVPGFTAVNGRASGATFVGDVGAGPVVAGVDFVPAGGSAPGTGLPSGPMAPGGGVGPVAGVDCA